MARISVLGTPFERALLQDLEKRQSLREHTINPPGQERYIQPIDKAALKAKLEEIGGAAVTAAEVDAFLAATLDVDDISLGEIDTQAVNEVSAISSLTADEQQDVQDLISYKFVETGAFLLSFNGGVIDGMLNVTDDDGNPAPWIKVFTDAGDALFTL